MARLQFKDLIARLEEILRNPVDREEQVFAFTRLIFEDSEGLDNPGIAEDFLDELAEDLDLYEPNPEWRREDPSFYGDEKLMKLVGDALEVLKKAVASEEP